MGCIYNRGTKARPNYWIKWIDHTGSPHFEKIGRDRGLAQATLAQREAAEKPTATRRPEGAPAPRFDAAADTWIEMRSAPDADGRPIFRAWRDDRTRLKLHLLPRFGARPLHEITIDDVRRLITEMRATHKPQTIRNVLHTMSRLFEDQPRALCLTNPVRALDRHDRRRIGRGWDPRKTPFLRSKTEVRSLYLALPQMALGRPFRAMYAVGVLAGLRPGEVRALEWEDLDNDAGLIHVQRSADGPTKDDQSRHVPIPPALASVLKEWRRQVPLGEKRIFPPNGRTGRYVDEDGFRRVLSDALEAAKLPPLTVYQATRHSFGAQWVKNGGSLVKLAETLGHSNTEVTARYGHLVPGEFSDADRALVDVDLEPAAVLPLTKAH